MSKFEKVGMFLLMFGGVMFTIMPYFTYKILSILLMTIGYFIVKGGVYNGS